jgi:alpha-L-arabinofuranosidase
MVTSTGLESRRCDMIRSLRSALEVATAACGTFSVLYPPSGGRQEAGHPEPFALDTVGIGNENRGQVFFDRFDLLRTDVQAHRPGTESIFSGSPVQRVRTYKQTWDHARSQGPELIVDEHFCASP